MGSTIAHRFLTLYLLAPMACEVLPRWRSEDEHELWPEHYAFGGSRDNGQPNPRRFRIER